MDCRNSKCFLHSLSLSDLWELGFFTAASRAIAVTRTHRIRKAIFPVAGLGTRFLPATKAMPKEMLTVVDRPLIQHVVDEAREAGIEHFIFVTGRNKGVIEDHFDRQFELEADAERARQEGRSEAARRAICRKPAPRASPASSRRSVSVTRCGARAKSSATSRSRCCCPTCWCSTSRGCLAQMIEAYAKLTARANVIAVRRSADGAHPHVRRRRRRRDARQ